MTDRPASQKSLDAYRTIGEVAEELRLPQHVLRFWETRFPQVKPLKRAGGRRFYRPEDVALLRAVQVLLYGEGYTIKGVQRLLQEFGARNVADALARSVPPSGGIGDVGPDQATAGEERAAALPEKGGLSRRARPAPPARSAPIGAPPAREAPPAAERPAAPDLVTRLEDVLADLSECGRLLSSVRATQD